MLYRPRQCADFLVLTDNGLASGVYVGCVITCVILSSASGFLDIEPGSALLRTYICITLFAGLSSGYKHNTKFDRPLRTQLSDCTGRSQKRTIIMLQKFVGGLSLKHDPCRGDAKLSRQKLYD